MKKISLLIALVSGCLIYYVYGYDRSTELTPERVVVELNINESQDITLVNGEVVEVEVLDIDEQYGIHREALRAATVKIAVDGTEVNLDVGNYHLPVTVGNVQIDSPVVKAYYDSTPRDAWKLEKDVRLRLWPKESPYLTPGTFVYPLKQTLFAGMTQMGNEPSYVPRSEPMENEIYYHSGLDFGGAEGRTEIVSATDGVVILVNQELLEGYEDFPGENPRDDVVYIEDNRGWRLYYAHLDTIDPAIKPGAKVKMGQKIGMLGKQGASGGWAHLHFEIYTNETLSGEWGSEDAYPYVWESYVREYQPSVIAVARPHQLLRTGQETTLDGSRARSFEGDIASHEWIFSDGTTAEGAVQNKIYEKSGEYSEILKVTDSKGNTDYDFTVVQVYDRKQPEKPFPTVHASFYPTTGIKPGEPVTFWVRTFNTDYGRETWDFGDGTPTVSVKSETVTVENRNTGKYAAIQHSFDESGQYVVKVERSDEHGVTAMAHLKVVVGDNDKTDG